MPTVNWGEANSFEYCFEGIEKGSAVAVSTYMFQAHGSHADQKELFMTGYREMLRRIEPEYIICYSEPFPEMEGNINYVDYELSSWKHMEDDAQEPLQIKRTYPFLTMGAEYDTIIKMGYVCKGSGSARGGKWQPKKAADERLVGEPGEVKTTYYRGYRIDTKIGDDGLAVMERHYTTSPNLALHTDPHDHEITWEITIRILVRQLTTGMAMPPNLSHSNSERR